jgi:hypothetical protein
VSDANAKQIDGAHYKKLKIQPWDYIVANNIPYLEGSAIKYLTRWRDKGGIQDLQKAQHFVEKLIEVAKAELDNGTPRLLTPADVQRVLEQQNAKAGK